MGYGRATAFPKARQIQMCPTMQMIDNVEVGIENAEDDYDMDETDNSMIVNLKESDVVFTDDYQDEMASEQNSQVNASQDWA